jgi:cell filamentation protein
VNDDDADQKQREEEREAALVFIRIRELRGNPIKGDFDLEHLRAVHAYIFQDLPQHRPGVVRDDTKEVWIKHRALEGSSSVYDIPYASQGVEAKITNILQQFGGSDAIKGLSPDPAAARIAQLYGALDHAHAFYEGNSRTLREFTRELASEAGYALDWVKTGISTKERNELYVARDLAVLENAFPNLTPEKAMQTNDRAEYEASFVMEGLRRAVGNKPLGAIIRESLRPAKQHERPRDDQTPLTANEVLGRFSDPAVQARYALQEQRRAQQSPSAPATPARAAAPAKGGEESAEEKKVNFKPITRGSDRAHERERENDKGGNTRGGGGRGGGRGRR